MHGLTVSRLWTCDGECILCILCICLVHGLTPSVSICTGCGHALGSAGRDDERAYDHRALHEGARLLSTAFYRSQEKIFCLVENQTCLSYLGPNFIYLGGQKYGYRPVPAIVDSAELKLLRETLLAMGTDVTLLDRSTQNIIDAKFHKTFCQVVQDRHKSCSSPVSSAAH